MILEQTVKDRKAEGVATQRVAARSRIETRIIEQQYLKFLEDAYLTLAEGQKPMFRDKVDKYSVPSQTTLAMEELGIVRKEGIKRWAKYTWLADVPDFAMAERVYDLARRLRYNSEQRAKHRRESALLQQNKEAEMAKRNMVKLDRNAIVHDHVITATVDKLRNTMAFLEALHERLGNQGWVNGQALGLGAMPAAYGVTKLVLLTAYPDILQHQGRGDTYEVCWATDSVPSLDMAARMVGREKEYIERITYSDEYLLAQLVDAGAVEADLDLYPEVYATTIEVYAAYGLVEEPQPVPDVPAAAEIVDNTPNVTTMEETPALLPQDVTPPAAAQDIRMQLAKLFTKAGEYETALELLTAITNTKNSQ